MFLSYLYTETTIIIYRWKKWGVFLERLHFFFLVSHSTTIADQFFFGILQDMAQGTHLLSVLSESNIDMHIE